MCVCVASIRHKGEGQGEMILRQWRFSFQGFLALHVIACSARGWRGKEVVISRLLRFRSFFLTTYTVGL